MWSVVGQCRGIYPALWGILSLWGSHCGVVYKLCSNDRDIEHNSYKNIFYDKLKCFTPISTQKMFD